MNCITANAGVSPMSMQNLVTLAAMTGGNGNLQVSPNSEYRIFRGVHNQRARYRALTCSCKFRAELSDASNYIRNFGSRYTPSANCTKPPIRLYLMHVTRVVDGKSAFAYKSDFNDRMRC